MNSILTRKVIDLHSKGYELDFVLEDSDHLICVQTNGLFDPGSLQIILVQQEFDQQSKRFKYIHTVETLSGDKGLLLSERLLLTSIYSRIPKKESAYAISSL